jgi:hypothetical protein
LLAVLKATDGLDASTHLFDLDYTEAIDALIAGDIDAAIVPELDGSPLQRALGAPGIRLMSVAQAEAIAKRVPGLKHVVLWRGLIDLSRDIPNSDVDFPGTAFATTITSMAAMLWSIGTIAHGAFVSAHSTHGDWGSSRLSRRS